MSAQSFDVIVIGGGPGGYVAAIKAAQLGLKTAVVERDVPGGICLNWGCIPTKALLKTAELYQSIQHAEDYGLKVSGVEFDFQKVVKRSRDVVAKMTKGVAYLLKKNKIELFLGTGSLGPNKTVLVRDNDGQETSLSYGNVIIATGGRARTLPHLPVDGQRVIAYREALELPELPQRLLVVGAGAIGSEFAYFYRAMGSEVTIVEILPQVLPIEDEEIAKVVEKSFKKDGIEVKTGTVVESLEVKGSSVKALLKSGDKVEEWVGDYALIAIGIQGNVEDLGLENVGLVPEKSFIPVDEYYQTGVPHIYAIGDITGPPLLAHVASHEGIVAVEHLSGHQPHPIDYNSIPACTFCLPQVASIGLTEKAAKEAGYSVKVGKFPFSASGQAVAAVHTEGMVKTLIDQQTEEVLGIHIVHHNASELIGEASIIRSHEGTATSVFATIHAHPTLSEAVMEAMGDALGQAIHI